MTKIKQRLAGFTLMELLIVLGIMVALSAILVPAIFRQRTKQLITRTQMEIQSLQGDLELYATENRGYPSTEQGLMALAYVPGNLGMLPGTTPTVIQPGSPTGFQDSMGAFGPGVGPEALNQPGGPFGGAGAIDPLTGQPVVGGAGAIDPLTGQPVVGTGTGAYSTWMQPFHNPQLYTRLQKRLGGIDVKLLTDVWGNPYRYDNTIDVYGVNQYTGEARPAIWSAGPDGKDNTDDDIRGWKPDDAQRFRNERIQQLQQQNNMYTPSVGPEMLPVQPNTGPMYDPNNPNMNIPPGQLPMTPGQPTSVFPVSPGVAGPGVAGPGGAGPGVAGPGGAGPGGAGTGGFGI